MRDQQASSGLLAFFIPSHFEVIVWDFEKGLQRTFKLPVPGMTIRSRPSTHLSHLVVTEIQCIAADCILVEDNSQWYSLHVSIGRLCPLQLPAPLALRSFLFSSGDSIWGLSDTSAVSLQQLSPIRGKTFSLRVPLAMPFIQHALRLTNQFALLSDTNLVIVNLPKSGIRQWRGILPASPKYFLVEQQVDGYLIATTQDGKGVVMDVNEQRVASIFQQEVEPNLALQIQGKVFKDPKTPTLEFKGPRDLKKLADLSREVSQTITVDTPLISPQRHERPSMGLESKDSLMAREAALQQQLEKLKMPETDFSSYHAIFQHVELYIRQLRSILQSTTSKQKERTWLRNQMTGELDDTKLVDGITGERQVFKKRGEAPMRIGGIPDKPKRFLFSFDLSASMAKYDSTDGRLQRSLEVAVMWVERLRAYCFIRVGSSSLSRGLTASSSI